jgi:hypothetical protein
VVKTHVPGLRPDTNLMHFNLSRARDGIATLALMLTPILAVGVKSWWRRWHPVDILVGLAAGLFLFRGPLHQLVASRAWPTLINGNLLAPRGALDSVALPGTRPLLYGSTSWETLNAVALIAALVFFAICGGAIGAWVREAIGAMRSRRGLRSLWPDMGSTWNVLVVFALLYGGGMVAWSFVFPSYDRYLWPLIIPIYALFLRQPAAGPAPLQPAVERPGPSLTATVGRTLPAVVGAIAVLCLTLTSFILLLNSDAFDVARWNMGNKAVAMGTPAGKIDAGFEWVTYNATGSAKKAPPPALGGLYDTRWQSFHLCALVSNSPLGDPRLTLAATESDAYNLMLFAGPSEPLYLYLVQNSDCP